MYMIDVCSVQVQAELSVAISPPLQDHASEIMSVPAYDLLENGKTS
jgi:hypothetical protein